MCKRLICSWNGPLDFVDKMHLRWRQDFDIKILSKSCQRELQVAEQTFLEDIFVNLMDLRLAKYYLTAIFLESSVLQVFFLNIFASKFFQGLLRSEIGG